MDNCASDVTILFNFSAAPKSHLSRKNWTDISAAFYNSGHAFPACFSARDTDFLRKEIEEVFKAGKHAVEEINKSNPQAAFAFTLFECIKGKSLARGADVLSRCFFRLNIL